MWELLIAAGSLLAARILRRMKLNPIDPDDDKPDVKPAPKPDTKPDAAPVPVPSPDPAKPAPAATLMDLLRVAGGMLFDLRLSGLAIWRRF